MNTLALIGFVGGLITGISPCILPVLPVIFFSGAQGARVDASTDGGVAVAVAPVRTRAQALRPYLVIAGLVTSFSAVTLVGSALLSLLHLPQDAIRWVALAALVTIGLGLIFPRVEQLLEKPFARLPQKQFATRSSGFRLGLTLGVLYVPCAGPVLAAIVVAGATGSIGIEIVVLTFAFAVGAALPLLFFALAGRRVAERVSAFRRHQREIRVAAGIVTILLAVALGVQRARGTATGHPRLHRFAAGQGRRRREICGEAQPRRPGQRAERATVQLHQWRRRAGKLRHRHRTSRASPAG